MVFPPVKIDCFVFRSDAVLFAVLLLVSVLCYCHVNSSHWPTLIAGFILPPPLLSKSEKAKGIMSGITLISNGVLVFSNDEHCQSPAISDSRGSQLSGLSIFM